MQFRKAILDEVDRILEIMDSARAFQRSLGFRQWEDGYPSRAIIINDIEQGDAYVLVADGIIVAYSVLTIGDDAYDSLPDTWMYAGEYGVVHRIAVAPEARGGGISRELFAAYEAVFAESGVNIIRIDTGENNVIMRHLLGKYGYESRGLRLFDWGPRMAFEKRLAGC